MSKIYGRLTEEQWHELGHVNELFVLYEHQRVHFWEKILAQMGIAAGTAVRAHPETHDVYEVTPEEK